MTPICMDFFEGYAKGHVVGQFCQDDSDLKKGRERGLHRIRSDSYLFITITTVAFDLLKGDKGFTAALILFTGLEVVSTRFVKTAKVINPLRDLLGPSALLVTAVASVRFMRGGTPSLGAGMAFALLRDTLLRYEMINHGPLSKALDLLSNTHALLKGDYLIRILLFMKVINQISELLGQDHSILDPLLNRIHSFYTALLDRHLPLESLPPAPQKLTSAELYQFRFRSTTALHQAHIGIPLASSAIQEDYTASLKESWKNWKFVGDEEKRFLAKKNRAEVGEIDPTSELSACIDRAMSHELPIPNQAKEQLKGRMRYTAWFCKEHLETHREAIFQALLTLTFDIGGKCDADLYVESDDVALKLAAAGGTLGRDYPILLKLQETRCLVVEDMIEPLIRKLLIQIPYLFQAAYSVYNIRFHIGREYSEYGLGLNEDSLVKRSLMVIISILDGHFWTIYKRNLNMLIDDEDVSNWWGNYFLDPENEHEELWSLVQRDKQIARRLMFVSMGVLR